MKDALELAWSAKRCGTLPEEEEDFPKALREAVLPWYLFTHNISFLLDGQIKRKEKKLIRS